MWCLAQNKPFCWIQAGLPSALLFPFIITLQSGVRSQLCLIRHAGLKAQVYVVRDKSKLVGDLFEKEPKVSLFPVWAK